MTSELAKHRPTCLSSTSPTFFRVWLRNQQRNHLTSGACAASADVPQPTAAALAAWERFVQLAEAICDSQSLRLGFEGWLRELGWTHFEIVTALAKTLTSCSSWLCAKQQRQQLWAWFWDDHCGLDTPRDCGGPVLESPQRLAERLLFENDARLGVVANAIELRVILVDEDGSKHFYAVHLRTQRDWAATEAVPVDLGLMHGWCGGDGAVRAQHLLDDLRQFRRTTLERLRSQLQRGIERFLSDTLQSTKRRAALKGAEPTAPLAIALWRETLLFAYCVLALAIVELNHPKAAVPGISSEPGPAHPVFQPSSIAACLEANEAPSNAGALSWSDCLRAALLTITGDGITPPSHGLDKLLPAAPFEHLQAMDFDDAACRILLESLLLVTPKIPAPKGKVARATRWPFELLSSRDLADLFESMLALCPGIALQPMLRHRRGKYDVVSSLAGQTTELSAAGTGQPRTRVRSARSASAPRPNTEVIPAGSFYLYAGSERKSSGSFYTPQSFVEYLLDGTIQPGALASPQTGRLSLEAVLGVSLLDPAAGAGAFLLGATARLGDFLLTAVVTQWRSRGAGPCREVADIPGVGEHLTDCLRSIDAATDDATRLWTEARQLCRIAVASRCIYGIDRNPLAVAVARLLLWLDCQHSACNATQLEHHVVAGDSLIGPDLGQLLTLPHSGVPLDTLGHADLAEYLRRTIAIAVGPSECAVPAGAGREPVPASDFAARCATIERALAAIAAVWTGGVMLGQSRSDALYLELLQSLAAGAELAPTLSSNAALLEQYELGKPALCFELRFPEIFARRSSDAQTPGFAIVIGNPPWDAVKANSREVLAEFDPRAFDVNTKSERDDLTRSLSRSPQVATRLRLFVADFEQRKRAHDRQFQHQKIVILGDLAGRQLDLFRLFVERSWQLLRQGGRLGVVVPSAFHTSAGAVGVRRLLLESGTLSSYVVFRNSHHLFEIARGFEFGLVLAEKTCLKDYGVNVRFGLERPRELLHAQAAPSHRLMKSAILAHSPYATISVADDALSAEIAAVARQSGIVYANWETQTQIRLRSTPTSVHRTHESPHFTALDNAADPRRELASMDSVTQRGVMLHEGATFHRYDDLWGEPPQFRLAASRLLQVQRWRSAIGHYRLTMRAIVGSSAHKCIATLLPPGTLVTNSALIEGTPTARPSAFALATAATLNSSTASWLLCAAADFNVNLFALRQLPWPKSLPVGYLAHAALRLCANHAAWEPLWREQLGDTWSEVTSAFTFPALPAGSARVAVIAEVDAVIAAAYGFTRAHYQKVLGRFGTDWLGASQDCCLAAFDAIQQLGLDEFLRQTDSYANVPLVLGLPRSSIELDGPGPSAAAALD